MSSVFGYLPPELLGIATWVWFVFLGIVLTGIGAMATAFYRWLVPLLLLGVALLFLAFVPI
jgi:hypothetical protein